MLYLKFFELGYELTTLPIHTSECATGSSELFEMRVSAIKQMLFNLVKILEKHDLINFSIRNDHPMKVTMQFDKLGNSALEYFLASRATKDEIYDDEEFDDF